MNKKRNIYKVSKKDSIEEAIEKNEKLINRVRNLEKENRRLKSENKTLQKAWYDTEVKLNKEVKDVSLEDVFESIENGIPLKKLRRACKECGCKKVRKLDYTDFEIVICGSCGYRAKIDK